MTENAATLEGPARWIGLGIAIIGALLANPEASLQAAQASLRWLRKVGTRGRSILARVIPALRRDGTVEAARATLNVRMPTWTGSARGFTPLSKGATIDDQITFLDERTRRLHEEVGELQRDLKSAERRLRQQLDEFANGTVQETEAVRQSIENLRTDIVRSDASALPIIVAGLALSGFAPDIASFQVWSGVLIIAVFVAVAVRSGWYIVQSRRGGNSAH